MVLLYSAGVSASGGVRGAAARSCCADTLDVTPPASAIEHAIEKRMQQPNRDGRTDAAVLELRTNLMINHQCYRKIRIGQKQGGRAPSRPPTVIDRLTHFIENLTSRTEVSSRIAAMRRAVSV